MTPSQNPNLHPVRETTPLKDIPSDMDNDPNADEEVIDQTGPTPSEEETDLQPSPKPSGRIPSGLEDDPSNDENLNEKIAYALVGAEPNRKE
ncbi:hypothetical protein [Larkinella sp.]|uniref:hypothetical protein n=1 Tax=Larkinella sp. TaxID=2034517 RepID=UPI003BAD80D8